MKTIKLPDGYNGDFAVFYVVPIEYDGDLVKLRCAEPGKEYMFSWRHRNDVIKALEVKL